jgi:hypothetical protein
MSFLFDSNELEEELQLIDLSYEVTNTSNTLNYSDHFRMIRVEREESKIAQSIETYKFNGPVNPAMARLYSDEAAKLIAIKKNM